MMGTSRPSGISVWDARGLPDDPLDAASAFASDHLPRLRSFGRHSTHIWFDPADHTHDSWRKAMVEELARAAAPGRINAVVGADAEAVRRVLDYLDKARGVTGQMFRADGKSNPER